MPAQIINQQSRVRMRFVNEIVDGKEQLMSRTYSGVKELATDTDVLAAAQQLGMLQTKTLKHVIRTDEKELIEVV